MRILLLAGGGGTRLWPLSSEERPKQFLPLLSEKSLLAETFFRLAPLSRDIWVATSDRYVDLVREDLPEVPASRILSEPARRNSGPALLSAALRFLEDGDPVTAVVPSDQTVADADAFRRALSDAARAAEEGSVAVLGVPPAGPDTDFGYIAVRPRGAGGLEVTGFVEKPDSGRAAQYVADGHLWNAGIFVFRPSRFLAQARAVAAGLVSAVERYRELLRAGRDAEAAEAYRALPAISIDYAVMEKAKDILAVPLAAGWSDVGTWKAVRQMRGASDGEGNLVLSDVPVLAPGVRESAIVVTPDGVLVLPFQREGELREAVEALRRKASEGKIV
ncbi:MAG: mannose-1-phosphate guanylyltransferase [Thermoanaerobaculia bacterium]